MAGANADGSALSPAPATDGDGFVTAKNAFDYAKANDTGPDDDPQYKANACGSLVTLGSKRPYIPIPIQWQYLFPWQIIPDPAPEQIAQLRTRVEGELRNGILAAPLGALLERTEAQLAATVREQLPQR